MSEERFIIRAHPRIDPKILLEIGTNLPPVMLPFPRLPTLSAVRYVLRLRCQIQHSENYETNSFK